MENFIFWAAAVPHYLLQAAEENILTIQVLGKCNMKLLCHLSLPHYQSAKK